MKCEAFENLKQQTALFREWASAYPIEPRSGEWECDYRNWSDLYDSFSQFIEDCPVEEWDKEAIETIIYLVARDNESEYLAGELAKSVKQLLFFAEASLSSSESNAKWQAAEKLSQLHKHLPEVEPILLQFVRDDNEYVRRRALMTLGRLNSPHVEALCEQAWNRNEKWQEYQRMAVLESLCRVRSALLPTFLRKAREDGRQHLIAFAAKVESGDVE